MITFFTIWYSNRLVRQLEEEEAERIQIWAEATRLLVSPEYEGDVDFLLNVVQQNNTIPVILTDESGKVSAYRNLNPDKNWDENLFSIEIAKMKDQNPPIVVEYLEGKRLYIYYENSIILNRLQFFPLIQLLAVAVFLILSYVSFSYSRRSEQDRVWVGMSKETAHQLGTPISSLMAWVELLESDSTSLNEEMIRELKNDLSRLEMITERFSKIGSKPALKSENLSECLQDSVQYLSKRCSSRIKMFIRDESSPVIVPLNRPLFAWVLENLTKNAIDAMKGEGEIHFELQDFQDRIFLDISDTGSGIPSGKWETIFQPGFTTKDRGWGLGLALVKRIVVDYHKGKIFVKESQENKGTTFRIVLYKSQ